MDDVIAKLDAQIDELMANFRAGKRLVTKPPSPEFENLVLQIPPCAQLQSRR